MRTLPVCALLLLGLSACQGEGGEPERGSGKADLGGTCSGRCGAQSQTASGCSCDAECAEFGDCCGDMKQVCDPSPGNPCVAAGGECLSDPNDVGFAADCSALGLTDIDAKCFAINQSCCGPATACAELGGGCVDGLSACPQPVDLPDDACGPMQTCCGAEIQHCGGLAGTPCDADEYCAFDGPSSCGIADIPGLCKKRPQACAAVDEPVCGCDGKTHASACQAHVVGIDVATDGACAD